jgi:hypothetical protein
MCSMDVDAIFLIKLKLSVSAGAMRCPREKKGASRYNNGRYYIQELF